MPRERRVRLSQRDHKILRHVGRYRLTTADVLHAVFFAGGGRDAVKSTLRRLCQARLLAAAPLFGKRVYYHLTPSGARRIGLPLHVARDLGLRAKAQRYAVLWFIAVDQPEQRSLFNPHEFPEQFPVGNHRPPQTPLYIEERSDGVARLGAVLVDYQSDSRRIVQRATSAARHFLAHEWFDDYLHSGAMTLTVLTTTDVRKQELTRKIRSHWRDDLRSRAAEQLPLKLRAAVVPELLELLAFRQPTTKGSQ